MGFGLKFVGADATGRVAWGHGCALGLRCATRINRECAAIGKGTPGWQAREIGWAAWNGLETLAACH